MLVLRDRSRALGFQSAICHRASHLRVRAAVSHNDAMESSARQIRTVLAAAYEHDPLMLWLFEGVDEPEHAIAAWLNVFVERYLASGRVQLADSGGQLAGVALWRLPGMSLPATSGLPTARGLLAAFVGNDRAQLLGQALHEIANLTPAEPHLYLHFLAVDARLRRTGVGAQLLQKSLSEARGQKVPVHLETTNPLAIPFYKAHGFRITAEGNFAANGPTVWAMLHP